MRGKLKIEERFSLYGFAQECAAAAAPIFQQQGWQWVGVGVPTREEIFESLMRLKYWAIEDNQEYGETGRLVYYKGQYGHEKAPLPAPNATPGRESKENHEQS